MVSVLPSRTFLKCFYLCLRHDSGLMSSLKENESAVDSCVRIIACVDVGAAVLV